MLEPGRSHHRGLRAAVELGRNAAREHGVEPRRRTGHPPTHHCCAGLAGWPREATRRGSGVAEQGEGELAERSWWGWTGVVPRSVPSSVKGAAQARTVLPLPPSRSSPPSARCQTGACTGTRQPTVSDVIASRVYKSVPCYRCS